MKMMNLTIIGGSQVLVNPLCITKVTQQSNGTAIIFLTDGSNLTVRDTSSDIMCRFEECTNDDAFKLWQGGK